MFGRAIYTLTDDEYNYIRNAIRATTPFGNVQQRANDAWKVVCDARGLDWMSVNQQGRSERKFTAIPLNERVTNGNTDDSHE